MRRAAKIQSGRRNFFLWSVFYGQPPLMWSRDAVTIVVRSAKHAKFTLFFLFFALKCPCGNCFEKQL